MDRIASDASAPLRRERLVQAWYRRRASAIGLVLVLLAAVVIWLSRGPTTSSSPEPGGARQMVIPTGAILTPGPDGQP